MSAVSLKNLMVYTFGLPVCPICYLSSALMTAFQSKFHIATFPSLHPFHVIHSDGQMSHLLTTIESKHSYFRCTISVFEPPDSKKAAFTISYARRHIVDYVNS